MDARLELRLDARRDSGLALSVGLAGRVTIPASSPGAFDYLSRDFTPATPGYSWRPGAGEWWALAWLAGTGLALYFQDIADDAYDDYLHLGEHTAQEDAFDKARRYDRYALSAWIGSEACFLMALREWLWGSGKEAP